MLFRLWTVPFMAALIAAGAQAQDAKSTKLSPQQLEQLAAPVALYPDALLAQIFMASTYPLDIVQAARWSKANPKMTGKALEDAMQKQPWDPSVKALTAVPAVLRMMSEKLDWTQKLGDAFLAQQQDLMKAVQTLRARAKAAGSLESNDRQKVATQTAGAQTVIIIESAQPSVIYVPVYNPTIVYGPWPYPTFPPYYWYPAGYVATRAVSFTAGVVVGAAIWGHCDWHGHSVNVNISHYNSFNRTTINNTSWTHNAARRGAVPYSHPELAQRYGKTASPNAANREAFRGRTTSGSTTANRANPGAPPYRRDHHSTGMNRPNAYDGIGQGAEVRRHSERGSTSRKSSRGQFRGSPATTGRHR
jgi:hypothetical protein